MPYIDGFVIPVPEGTREEFVSHARHFDSLMIEDGALRVIECWGDDVKHGQHTDFFRAVNATENEAVVFSWVEWPDKETRDAAHAKMRARMDAGELGSSPDMPFDGKRLVFGGFVPVLELGGA